MRETAMKPLWDQRAAVFSGVENRAGKLRTRIDEGSGRSCRRAIANGLHKGSSHKHDTSAVLYIGLPTLLLPRMVDDLGQILAILGDNPPAALKCLYDLLAVQVGYNQLAEAPTGDEGPAWSSPTPTSSCSRSPTLCSRSSTVFSAPSMYEHSLYPHAMPSSYSSSPAPLPSSESSLLSPKTISSFGPPSPSTMTLLFPPSAMAMSWEPLSPLYTPSTSPMQTPSSTPVQSPMSSPIPVPSLDLPSTSSLNPHRSLSSSPPSAEQSSSSQRKRPHNDPLLSKSNTIPHDGAATKRQRLLDAGHGGDDGGGGAGAPGHAINWDPNCVRNGSRSRTALSIGLNGVMGIAAGDNHALFESLDENEDGDDETAEHQSIPHADEDTGCAEETPGVPPPLNPNTRNKKGTQWPYEEDTDYVPSSGKKGKGGLSKKGKGPKPAKASKKNASWNTDGKPPPVTPLARFQINTMAKITSKSNLQKLVELIQSLQSQTSLPSSANQAPVADPSTPVELAPLRALALRCDALEKDVCLTDFNFMVTLIQLALSVDIFRKSSISRRPPGLDRLAEQVGFHKTRFRDWVSWGTRLAFLTAAATPHILFIIAALGMRVDLTQRKAISNDDIYSIAFNLCSPQDDELGVMVKTILIPFITKLRHVPLPGVSFMFFPKPGVDNMRCGNIEVYANEEIGILDLHFGTVTTNYFPLPSRSAIWTLSSSVSDSREPLIPEIAETVTITMSRSFPKTPCPLTTENRDEWTTEERIKAAAAPAISNLNDLKAKLTDPLYQGDGKYIQISSDICDRKTLKILDADQKLVGLLVTHLGTRLRGCNKHLVAKLKAALPGELYFDTSDRPGYKFLAFHFSWYNRYAEKGDGAPENVHPYHVYKDGATSVNHWQRVPRSSKDILENPAEYDLLADFLQDIMDFTNANVQHHLPKECKELVAYVERIPLNERSPAYPFGGFVINMCVATRGHRDPGDKLLCVVIPFGDYTGGELCLYEPGLVLKLAPADVFVFPSCRTSHFNLHFQGIRASLVLHSDKQGDSWVKTANGWQVTRVEFVDN